MRLGRVRRVVRRLVVVGTMVKELTLSRISSANMQRLLVQCTADGGTRLRTAQLSEEPHISFSLYPGQHATRLTTHGDGGTPGHAPRSGETLHTNRINALDTNTQ